MTLAHHVAQWSKDPSRKVGCVITDIDKHIIGVGYNGFPKMVQDLPERLNDREQKLLYTQHAERNALYNSKVLPGTCYMYTTLSPCVECAKSIIAHKIIGVIYDKPVENPEFYPEVTKQMFHEAGVLYYSLDEYLELLK